jgi:uncharacterized membrane protein YebE (DUF533 family)
MVAAVLSLGAVGSFAQEATPRVDQRQENQAARIQQGAASGALTGREQHRLQREQRAIARAENKAKADGTVTGKERAHLEHMQDHASRDIHHQKHDRQRAHRPGVAASAPKG